MMGCSWDDTWMVSGSTTGSSAVTGGNVTVTFLTHPPADPPDSAMAPAYPSGPTPTLPSREA